METPDLNNVTSSLKEVTTNLSREEVQHFTELYRRMERAERDLHALKVEKIITESQLPPELLVENNLLPHPPRKLKRGWGHRPLLSSEIEEAIKHSKFCAGQARWLGINIQTYRKYAMLYGLWKPHQFEKGKRQFRDPETGRYPLSRVLRGELNDVLTLTDAIVKRKLLSAETFPERCSKCGFKEKMVTTGRVPLLIDHMDGNRHNFKVENLRFLCWNCTILCGRGYTRGKFCKFDPDCWGTDDKSE